MMKLRLMKFRLIRKGAGSKGVWVFKHVSPIGLIGVRGGIKGFILKQMHAEEISLGTYVDGTMQSLLKSDSVSYGLPFQLKQSQVIW